MEERNGTEDATRRKTKVIGKLAIKREVAIYTVHV